MSRENIRPNKIALLATGDEISNGDILNTNTQEIARTLFDNGMQVGMHLVTSDNVLEIENAIRFLLETHEALIITGGLGPTSDDLTRFALAHATQKPLVFHEDCWENIVARLKRFGYDNPPESNRQQALFPEGATVIPNANGTAAGCMMRHQHQHVFMLPGPPVECLPMFNQVVLAELKNLNFPQVQFHKNWLLFGVSEGQIAEELDQLAKPFDCVTGYRLSYPYIEFKLHSSNAEHFHALAKKVEQSMASCLIADGQHTASSLLRKKLETLNFTLQISDHATGGLLESTLVTPKTCARLQFTTTEDAALHVNVKGLDDYWQQTAATHTTFALELLLGGEKRTIEASVPLRGSRVKSYVVEFVCWKVLSALS